MSESRGSQIDTASCSDWDLTNREIARHASIRLDHDLQIVVSWSVPCDARSDASFEERGTSKPSADPIADIRALGG